MENGVSEDRQSAGAEEALLPEERSDAEVQRLRQELQRWQTEHANVLAEYRRLVTSFGWKFLLRVQALYQTLVPFAAVRRAVRVALSFPGRLFRSRSLEQTSRPIAEEHADKDPATALRAINTNVSPSPFYDYQGYLCSSMTQPYRFAPFTEEDRCVLSVMEWNKRRLVHAYQDQPQDRLVSVIIPTYNRATWLPKAIDSVLAQSYGNLELFIADDGSTDATADVVCTYSDPRITYLRMAENRGKSAALNHALARAHGFYVAYLDSDNTWDEHFLLVMVQALRESGWARWGYSAQTLWRGYDPGTRQGRDLFALRFAPFNWSLLQNNNYIDHNAMIHERSLLERCGGFDESQECFHDWELALHLSDREFPLAVPAPLSHYLYKMCPDCISLVVDRGPNLRRVREEFRARQPLGDAFDALPEGKGRDLFGLGVPDPPHHPPRPVAIVIPNYEALPYLQACITSIRLFTPAGYHIHVVDNGSGAEVLRYLRAESVAADLSVISNDANLGFSHAVNQGITQAAVESDIIIMNDDALVTPGWLQAMQAVIDDVPDAGIVAPRQVLPAGTPTIAMHVPFADATFETDVNLSAHHQNVLDPFFCPEKGYVELSFVPFFCVYILRETLNACGHLDTEHGPHYRSDRLYCDVVRNFGKKRIIYTPHAKVYHFLQQSTHAMREHDPALYKSMYVENDWEAIQKAAERRRVESL
ncbi:MAG: glycosyltransferase [Candidatus Peregrinibacteria bacterium]